MSETKEIIIVNDTTKKLKAEIALRRRALKSMTTKIEGYLVIMSTKSDNLYEISGWTVDDVPTVVFNQEMDSSLTSVIDMFRDTISNAQNALDDFEKELDKNVADFNTDF